MTLRDFLKRTPVVRWAELALLIFFVAGSLALVNYIAFRHVARFDLTPEKRYTLSEQTVQVLRKAAGPVKVTVFTRQQDLRELQDLLGLFGRASEGFTYEVLDLEKNPARAEALGVKGYGAGVMEYQGRREKLLAVTEDGLLTALLKLSDNTEKIVRFVKGHGEKDVLSMDPKDSYSLIARELKTENYRVEELMLLQASKVPQDTQVLIVAGPEKDLLPSELGMIEAYLKSGGRVLLLCDPFPLPNVEAWLGKLQIKIGRDYLIDPQSKLMAFDSLTPIIMPDKRHPIARGMNEAVVFPVCRSVMSAAENTELRVLALSGPESWAETDTKSVRTNSISFDPRADMRGPVPVAVIEDMEQAGGSNGVLIAMGNSGFATNHYLNVLGNKDFFMNTVNFLAENSGLLSARSKSAGGQPSMFFLTELQSRLVFWSAVVIEPSLVLLAGILVVLWRRFRR